MGALSSGGGGGGGGGAGGSFVLQASGALRVFGTIDVRGGNGGNGGNGAISSSPSELKGGDGGGGGGGGAGGFIVLQAQHNVEVSGTLLADGGSGGAAGNGGGSGDFTGNGGYPGAGGGGGRISLIAGTSFTGFTNSSGTDASGQNAGAPTKTVTIFGIEAEVVNQDNPYNTISELVPIPNTPLVFGGSQDSTSDKLSLHLNGPVAGAISYQWSVTGPSSSAYPPPPSSSVPVPWQVGSIHAQAGMLNFAMTVLLPGGRQLKVSRQVEVAIRSDDVILVGWIDPIQVPLDTIEGVDETIQYFMPRNGRVISSFGCNSIALELSENITNPTGPELQPNDRAYILNWLTKFAGNIDPSQLIPGEQFLDAAGVAADELKVANYRTAVTNYKLINRFQVKMRITLDTNTGAPTSPPFFNGPPIYVRTPITDIGTTINPCGPFPGVPDALPGQAGPLNGTSTLALADRISMINDGSHGAEAVRAFNTLEGKDVPWTPVFWENIGSRITFTAATGATRIEVMQNYPSYNIYLNGRFAGQRVEASSILEQFQTNPYPFGTAPCDIGGRITPGGRCGDARSAPDPTARIPLFIVQ